MDENVLGKIFSAATAAWAAVCMLAVGLFKTWPLIMERVNERRRDSVAERAGDWTRLREENERLHRQLADCEKMRVEWMRRAITAEATLQGYGDVDQRVAMRLAAERLAMEEENRRKKPEGSGK